MLELNISICFEDWELYIKDWSSLTVDFRAYKSGTKVSLIM